MHAGRIQLHSVGCKAEFLHLKKYMGINRPQVLELGAFTSSVGIQMALISEEPDITP